MSGIGKFKLSDAVPQPSDQGGKGRKKKPTALKTDAEQTREASENEDAKNAVPTTRDRMVEIGRGNQQAGRQGS